VAAFGQAGDILIALSTSGRSRNVTSALQEARGRGLHTIALLGGNGGETRAQADMALVVPSDDTQHIQEAHLVILHLLADLVDRAWRHREVVERAATTSASPAVADAPDGEATATIQMALDTEFVATPAAGRVPTNGHGRGRS